MYVFQKGVHVSTFAIYYSIPTTFWIFFFSRSNDCLVQSQKIWIKFCILLKKRVHKNLIHFLCMWEDDIVWIKDVYFYARGPHIRSIQPLHTNVISHFCDVLAHQFLLDQLCINFELHDSFRGNIGQMLQKCVRAGYSVQLQQGCTIISFSSFLGVFVTFDHKISMPSLIACFSYFSKLNIVLQEQFLVGQILFLWGKNKYSHNDSFNFWV